MRTALAQIWKNAFHTIWKGTLAAAGSYLTTMIPMPKDDHGPAAFFVGLIIWGLLHGVGIAASDAAQHLDQPAVPAKGK